MNAGELMRAIQMYDFYLLDLHLYLDTHPYDRRAMELYREYNGLRDTASRTYSEMFGPLTWADAVSDGHFNWTMEPWPWERSAN